MDNENMNVNMDPEMIEINKYIESLEFDQAKILIEKRLNADPNNTDLLDTMSEVLIGLDETENVIKAIKKSIALEPNKNGDKYMTLGQLTNDCRDALRLYEKGVTVFIDELKSETNLNKIMTLKNSVTSSYASIAELYMTTDLCNEPNAEEMCEKCLCEAIKFSPDSHDALIQISNLRILRKRDDEALLYMEKIYSNVLHCINTNDDNSLPSQDILLNLSKNYAELAHYVKAIKLLDVLIKLNDEDLELWYLLAFNHYTIKNYKHALKCLKNFKRVAHKVSYKSDDVLELEDAARELESSLEIIKKSQGGELKNNILEESEDNDEEKMMNNSNVDEMNID